MHSTRHLTWLLLALLITGIGIFTWITYRRTNNLAQPNKATTSVKTDDHIILDNYRSNTIKKDTPSSPSVGKHHDTKITAPLDSTFEPTPSTCPYHE